MSRAATLGLLLAMVAALAWRCPQLEQRPMHNDEAVNAIKFRALWERGVYRYDPNEHHGPMLFYLTLGWAKLTGATDFVQMGEARFRMLTVLFGVGLILLLPLVADGLGRGATVWAAVFTAISPAMVFYSRYYIHEMLLVFFTFLALASAWRYSRNPKVGWALLAGLGFGLMQATKETFVLTLAAMAGALALNAFWERRSSGRGRPPFALNRRHLAAAAAVWLAAAVLFFSSFFTNASGPVDSLRTYLPWVNRAAGASPHLHPWYYYLARLAYFHEHKGPVFSEGLILALAIIGGISGFTRFALAGANAGFVRFLAIYAFLLTAIYSAIAYKTPWCLLNFWHPMILLAGVGAMVAMSSVRRKGMKLIVTGCCLCVATGQLAVQAWQLSATYAADQRNPYIYSQTSLNLLELVAEVEALAKASPDGRHLLIKVMAPDSDYWPLPWYLRGFDQVGWWDKLPADPYAPVMIVSTAFKAELDEKKTHVMVGYFELRPQVFLELYVRLDLWRAYLAAKPKPPE